MVGHFFVFIYGEIVKSDLKQSCKNVPTVRTSQCYFFWLVLIFGYTRKNLCHYVPSIVAYWRLALQTVQIAVNVFLVLLTHC